MSHNPANKPVNNKVYFWNNPRYRALLFQILLIISLAGSFIYFTQNILANLESSGVSTGLSFLGDKAGFGVLQSLIPYSENSTYGRTFVVGLLNTLLVSALGIITATILGFFIGIARLSKNWLLSKLATIYIEIFRNIPLLLQIFFWYFAVLSPLPSPRSSYSFGDSFFLNVRGFYFPDVSFLNGFGFSIVAFVLGFSAFFFIKKWLKSRQKKTGKFISPLYFGFLLLVILPFVIFIISGSPLAWNYPELKGFNITGGGRIIPELLALWLALSIYTAAFIAEIVRSGIESVDHGQIEAAHSLGLNNWQNLKLVIIPQAMRVITPPLTSQYLNLTKNSSLATAIAYPDLVNVFMGTTLSQTGQAIEIVAITMAVYLLISLSISVFMNWYNDKMMLRER